MAIPAKADKPIIAPVCGNIGRSPRVAEPLGDPDATGVPDVPGSPDECSAKVDESSSSLTSGLLTKGLKI